MNKHKAYRVCIIGNSGSGKSTLAKVLGRQLDVPVFHLDRELLHGQFVAYTKKEQLIRHAALIAQENWIIDGDYKSFLSQRLERATAVIFLDVSRFITVPRLIARFFKDSLLTKSVPADARNRASVFVLKRTIGYNRQKKLQYLRELCLDHPHAQLIILKPGTIGSWLENILLKLKKANPVD